MQMVLVMSPEMHLLVKRRAILLSVCESKVYKLMCDLLAPAKQRKVVPGAGEAYPGSFSAETF